MSKKIITIKLYIKLQLMISNAGVSCGNEDVPGWTKEEN